jgi:hypothetical protein
MTWLARRGLHGMAMHDIAVPFTGMYCLSMHGMDVPGGKKPIFSAHLRKNANFFL